ncbi:MAG: hypothetical protein WC979_04750 [Candidatus Pacearchaeota archaeon]|jgi:DNA-binding HxlR family transcriptional regulator
MPIDKEVIWILRGSQRKDVFVNLPDTEFMPNKLRKELNQKISLNLSLREISRHLRDFEKRGFVSCINSNDPYNKIYKITNLGLKTKERVKSLSV